MSGYVLSRGNNSLAYGYKMASPIKKRKEHSNLKESPLCSILLTSSGAEGNKIQFTWTEMNICVNKWLKLTGEMSVIFNNN